MEATTDIKLKTTHGQYLDVSLRPPADNDSFFLLSLHKAGSTLLNKMMRAVCDRMAIPVFEPEIVEFENGVELGSLLPEVQDLFRPKGYCFAGFRCWRPYMQGFDFTPFKKILLIRDPRDMLVSHYFSHKFSHEIPQGPLGDTLQNFRSALDSKPIDDYALEQAAGVRGRFLEYKNLVIDSNTKLYRYEDIIFDKENWLREMLDYVSVDLPEDGIQQISKQFDRRPNNEDPSRHVRKVTPGDHIEKLKPETICELNSVFADIMDEYGYQR